MSDDCSVIGEIRPDPAGGPPLFKVIRREAGRWSQPESGCKHGNFKLDEKWSEVTCGECEERLNAFDVLLRYAEWEERYRVDMGAKERAERSLLRESLRRLKRLRDTAPDEQEEIQVILDRYEVPLSELRELDRRVTSAVSERKMDRRVTRDRKSLGLKQLNQRGT